MELRTDWIVQDKDFVRVLGKYVYDTAKIFM